MVYERGVGGMLSRLKDRPKWQLLLIAGGVVGVLIVVVLLMSRMSGGEGDGGAAGAGGDSSGLDGEAGGEGFESAMEYEMRVSGDVAATVAAMEPTSTPEPTADVAATVTARLGAEVRGSDELALSRVLDGSGYRDPVLRSAERALLERLGGVFWEGVLVYLALADVVKVDFTEVSWTLVEDNVKEIDYVLGLKMEIDDEGEKVRPELEWSSLEKRDGYSGSGHDVDEVVAAYVERVWISLEGLREAGLELRSMNELFHDAGVEYVVEMSPSDREVLEALYLGIGYRLSEFDRMVSRYGCSICGELFRQEQPVVE